MINELLSRPNIQEFLNKYPSSRWKELIADLFEIGVLNLRNSYHRDEYSKKEFRALIYDLQQSSYNPEYNPPNPHYNQYPNYKNRYSNTPYSQKYDYNYNHNYYPKENIYNCPCNNYDYERRKHRIKKLEQHSSTSKMDAFYSEKNVVYPNQIPLKQGRRNHQQIMDKIAKSQQLRDVQRYKIRDLKMQYLQEREEELKHKRMEKMMEKQAEEDIKYEEKEKQRIKQEQDYQEGYGEEYQEEDEVEEEENDKYNDYNREYNDEEGEGEEGYEEQNYEGEEQEEYDGYQDYNQNNENMQNMPMPEN